MTLPPLPPLEEQAERLIELGVHQLAGISAEDIRAAGSSRQSGLLTVHEKYAPASALASMMQHSGKSGFVVEDMVDVDEFTPLDASPLPTEPCYLLGDLQRGDEMANWSPDEALAAITEAGRVPLTLTEGIQWLLHTPDALERGKCFMTIGSRLRKANGTLDSRTPALWISNGTGRDGKDRRNAPKVGWCWAGNRHTWLGFASAAQRITLSPTSVS